MDIYVLLHFEHKDDVTIIIIFHRGTRLRLVSLQKFFCVQNVIEHRFLWNKC